MKLLRYGRQPPTLVSKTESCCSYYYRDVVHLEDVGNSVAEPNLRQSPYATAALVRLPQGQQRTTSNDHEVHPFHNDVSDTLAMYVPKAAAAGGESLLASGARIYSDIAGTRPEVIKLLTEPDSVFNRNVVHSLALTFKRLIKDLP